MFVIRKNYTKFKICLRFYSKNFRVLFYTKIFHVHNNLFVHCKGRFRFPKHICTKIMAGQDINEIEKQIDR